VVSFPVKSLPVTLLDLKRKLLGFVYQPACCFCDCATRLGENKQRTTSPADQSDQSWDDIYVCDHCFGDVVGSTLDRCYFCGTETNPYNPFGSRCRDCRHLNAKFERAFSIGAYRGKLKRTILDVKRDSDDVKAYQLGTFLGSMSNKFDLPENIDCVVPIPSHWRRRMSRRGFHITDVIADGFSKSTGIRKNGKLLKCSRFIKKQAKMRPAQRIKNVRGAFVVPKQNDVMNKRILLLDDVMTSGATVTECSKVLMRNGAESVFVAVAARSIGIS